MATTTLDNRNNNGLWFYLLVFACLAIVFAVTLGALELTQHAEQGRENTTLDAAAIAKMIDDGICKPVEAWECPLYNQRKVICKIKGNLWGGLILGTATNPPVIVTGYPATYAYWQAACLRDECYLATYTP